VPSHSVILFSGPSASEEGSIQCMNQEIQWIVATGM